MSQEVAIDSDMRVRNSSVPLLLAALACAPHLSKPEADRTTQPSPSVAKQPTLVVGIVVDQLGSWVLQEHARRLDRRGLLRRMLLEGRYYPRVRFTHASTYTAPGHATLLTGVAPRDHGILANERWVEGKGGVPWIDDGEFPVLGNPERSASPRALRTDTVGDALRRGSRRARVLSVSLKDRAAVLMAGKKADLAVWYDAAIPGFTTSTYYARELPPCIQAAERQTPLSSLLQPWTVDSSRYQGLAPDAAPGEGHWLGLDQRFPHDVRATTHPYSALRATPQLSEHMLDVALRCARDMDLGRDDVTDLLLVSISGTDYVGHVWGPQSWEMSEMLRKVDLALARWIDQIRQSATVRVLLTADHGVTPLPETRGLHRARLIPSELTAELQAHLRKELGPGQFISGFVAPYVIFGKDGHQRSPEAHRVVGEYLARHAAVFGSYPVRDLPFYRKSRDVVHRAVAQSMRPDAPGDVLIVPKPGALVDPGMAVGEGTSHGSPWVEDAIVPVLMWGSGIQPSMTDETVDARRVAATLASWLSVPAPGHLAPLD